MKKLNGGMKSRVQLECDRVNRKFGNVVLDMQMLTQMSAEYVLASDRLTKYDGWSVKQLLDYLPGTATRVAYFLEKHRGRMDSLR